jgi:hypothetical protein
MSSNLCISTSLSQSTLASAGVIIIICAGAVDVAGADEIWVVRDDDARESRGRDVVGDVGEARISRKRSSIVASETVSDSWWWWLSA